MARFFLIIGTVALLLSACGGRADFSSVTDSGDTAHCFVGCAGGSPSRDAAPIDAASNTADAAPAPSYDAATTALEATAPTDATPPSTDNPYVEIAAGKNFSCVRHNDGLVQCWGAPQIQTVPTPDSTDPKSFFLFGRLVGGYDVACGLVEHEPYRGGGEGRKPICWHGDASYNPSPTDTTFLTLDPGPDHSCGILSGGSLLCWGNTDHGQTAAPDGSFVAIQSGTDSSCALRDDGSISCWGAQATQLSGSFTALSFRYSNGCAIRSTDHTIQCWGISDPPALAYDKVSAGDGFACAITSTDRSLYCWGNNALTPPSGKFTTVAAGAAHACAIHADNTIACWGSNVYGESTPPAR